MIHDDDDDDTGGKRKEQESAEAISGLKRLSIFTIGNEHSSNRGI